MKKKLSILCGLIIMMLISGCKYDPSIANPADYASVYMPQAESVKELIFRQAEGRDRIIIGASYAGVDEAPEDIQVNFDIDLSLVNQYNEDNGTNFLPLPLNNISFSTKEVTIKKGKQQSPALPIDIDFSGLPTFTAYLLPVTIASSSGNTPLKEELRTAYFRIEVRSDPTPMKIMVFGKGNNNLPEGYSVNSPQGLALVADIIKSFNPDICVITEMHVNSNTTPDRNTPQELFELLESPYYEFINGYNGNYQRTGGAYGIAVYSKYPISNIVKHQLSQSVNNDWAPLGIMELNVEGHTVNFAASHLMSDQNRRRNEQLPELITAVEEYIADKAGRENEPFILAGHLNTRPNAPGENSEHAQLANLGLFPVCPDCPANHLTDPNAYNNIVFANPNTLRYSVADFEISPRYTHNNRPSITTLNLYF